MILTGFFFLLFGFTSCPGRTCDLSSSNQSSEPLSAEKCSEMAILNHLNLTTNNEQYTMSRPVPRYNLAVNMSVLLVVQGILDVKEIDQTVTLQTLTRMKWTNHFTKWNPEDFCGISEIKVPTETLWKPDMIVTEMITRTNNPPSPFLRMHYNGLIESRTEEVMVTTCKMRIYKFPFDTQSCNITFKSITYTDEELGIVGLCNNNWVTNKSAKAIKIDYEWLHLNTTFDRRTTNTLHLKQWKITFTVFMQRRATLYIANFLLPILFFLIMDLASFLISNNGDKLSFKITVLLAVTVMQLLLNDILPGSSSRIPVIAIFCIGIFALMLLSVLETILLMNLIERDASSQEKETEQSPRKNQGCSSSHLLQESSTLEKVLDELEDIKNMMTPLSNGSEEEQEGYWTKMAKRLDKVFMMLYFPAVIVFLIVICVMWNSKDDADV